MFRDRTKSTTDKETRIIRFHYSLQYEINVENKKQKNKFYFEMTNSILFLY